MKLDQLPSPCAVVDLEVFERNAARMAEKAHRLGVRLRPHVKTHKCVEAARLQVAGHFGGITVSTLAEARFFADAGFSDIIYAVPVAPSKLDDVIELAERIDRLAILVDDASVVGPVEEAAKTLDRPIEVFLKVDVGGGRAGVDPGGETGEALAEAFNRSPDIAFRGILTHAGQSYDCTDVEAVAGVAAIERDIMVAFADRLRRAGIEVPEISIGSTPTAHAFEDLTGIDEIRPGNYAFHDAFQTAIGSCRLEDVSFFVMASVVGVYPNKARAVIDAGALAFSKDRGPIHVRPDCGFGLILDNEFERSRRGLRLSSLSQEHGVISGTKPDTIGQLSVGDRLRIVPNHSCLAAACFDRYHVVKGEDVVDVWKPARGWT